MKKYLITDPRYYSTDAQSFKEALNRSLIKYTPDFVCFRDKTAGDKRALLDEFAVIAQKNDFISFVNGSLEYALEYGFDGVHLRSDQLDEIKFVKSEALFCMVSCHSQNEAATAIAMGCDFVTLSPVFDTPDKGMPMGFESFVSAAQMLDKTKLIALGGIDDENKAKMIEASGVYGFASIRYFVR